MTMRQILTAAVSGMILTAMAFAAPPASAKAKPALTIKVITSSEPSLYADSTLIMGEHDAVLVDVPFARSDGLRLAADVLESGKTLKTIYITHDHPDHYFSIDVFTDLFPGVEVISAPQVVDDIWRSYPLKLKRWGPLLGANGPRHPVAVSPAKGKSFMLEGHEIDILGPMQGDHVHATAIWVPSIKTLVCGDLCFNKIHLWLGEHGPKQYDAWLHSLDRLIALKPKTVVAGHKRPGLPDDASSLAFTKRYLLAFKAAATKSKNSAELIATIKQKFPDTQDVLNNFLLPNSAKVAMHEEPPWTE